MQILSAFSFIDGEPAFIQQLKGDRYQRLGAFEHHPALENFHNDLRVRFKDGGYYAIKTASEASLTAPEVTVIRLPPEVITAIQESAIYPVYGIGQQGQFIAWLRFLTQRAPELGYLDEMQNLLVLPSVRFFDAVRDHVPGNPPTPKIKMGGFYCAMDFDQLARLRQTEIHPLALYFPGVEEHSLVPDGAFLGSLSLRHDLYHVLRLDAIPLSHRKWL